MKTTEEKVKAAFDLVVGLSETIRELGEVVDGHLYAAAMHKVDLHGYQKAIGLLCEAGLVKRMPGHILKWGGAEHRAARGDGEVAAMTRTITDDQIRALRAEAAAAGDKRMVEICDTALNPWHEGFAVRLRDKARAECARIIAEANAQEDEQ